MGDLAADTALTDLGDGSYSRALSRDWEIWGPNGGYMAAIALRAAGLAANRPRPANATVHFLGVASFDEPVTVRPVVQRASKVATSVRVAITQADRPVLEAMVWAIDGGLPGLVHDVAVAPDMGHPLDFPTNRERFAAEGRVPPPGYAFWDNFEQRQPRWVTDWDDRSGLDPTFHTWMRFLAGADPDPWLEAARLLLLVDLGAWPAANAMHPQRDFIAPSIDVSCEFHHLASHSGWYHLSGLAPVAGNGLVASHQEVYDVDGRLLASGISHLLCRPVR